MNGLIPLEGKLEEKRLFECSKAMRGKTDDITILDQPIALKLSAPVGGVSFCGEHTDRALEKYEYELKKLETLCEDPIRNAGAIERKTIDVKFAERAVEQAKIEDRYASKKT